MGCEVEYMHGFKAIYLIENRLLYTLISILILA